MNTKKYDIYLVPNGRLRDFARGILGAGYPDGCQLWGHDLTLDEVRERYRALADQNFRRDGGEYDRIWDRCAAEHPEQAAEGFSEPETACAKYLDELTADPDPLNWSRIEWDDDMKWVCIREEEV